jgi:hypothetical protein
MEAAAGKSLSSRRSSVSFERRLRAACITLSPAVKAA